MPRRRDDRARVLGPTWIPSRQQWRITVITTGQGEGDRQQSARWFGSEALARDTAEELRAEVARLSGLTIAEAIARYETHLREKNSGSNSHVETVRRLRLFFPAELPIGRVTPERARGYYDAFRRRTRPDGAPISVDYHRGALVHSRTFLGWAVEMGWLTANPLIGVKGVGNRSAGKAQHTGDETRKFFAYCLARAEAGDTSALGVLMALLMALRSSDLTRRLVRDCDLDCTQLRVERGKTAKSNRPRKIPVVLQPMLRRLVAGRDPFAPLFAADTKDGHHGKEWLRSAMHRHCRRAGVPYVCPHALKGTAGTLLAETGELADRIADHLSHESATTTTRHYLAPGALEGAATERALRVITGGRG